MNVRLPIRWKRGLGTAALLGSLLAGCAVLTVDVDVYKGALMNEDHVQLHQLVALATAAKPMLVQLRDKLEWPMTEGIPSPKPATCPLDWYKPRYVKPLEDDFIPKPSPGFLDGVSAWFKGQQQAQQKDLKDCPRSFQDVRARLVNSVLSLYEDLDSADFSSHGTRLRDIARILKRTIPNHQADQEAFDAIAEGFKPDKDINTSLKEGYKQFLVVNATSDDGDSLRRDIRPLMKALGTYAPQPKGAQPQNNKQQIPETLEKQLISYWSSQEGTSSGDNSLESQSSVQKQNGDEPSETSLYDRRLPGRASWKYLGEAGPDSRLAQAGTDLCKGDQAEKASCKAQLLNRTKKLVDDYWESRQATHDLWEEGLNLLVLIQRLDRSQPDRYFALRRQLLDLVLNLTSVPSVASALDRVQGTDRCAALKSLSVLDLMCAPTIDGPLRWTEANATKNRTYFEEALRKALTVHPEETASFLLYLDSIEQDAPQLNGNATVHDLVKTANEINRQRPVRLGLTLSLADKLFDENDLVNSRVLFDLVNQVSHGLAQGFERGRPVEGLHRLTEAFLASHDGTNRTLEHTDQRKLTDALIGFAQKVLFLANHDWLVSPPRSGGLILGGGERLVRGLFGDDVADSLSTQSYIGPSRVPQEEERAYLRLLQAVGNSILFSTNELRVRDRFDEVSKSKVPAEVDAANAAYSANAMTLVDELLAELEWEKKAAEDDLATANKNKTELEKKLCDTSTNLRTGLCEDKDAAKKALTDAQTDLNTYRNPLSKLEAIHGLLTAEIIQQVKAQWTGESLDRPTISDFLTGTSGPSLQKALVTAKTAQGIPSPKETQRWNDALDYVKDSTTATSFTAYRDISNKQASLNRSELFDVFIKHVKQLEADRVKAVKLFETKRDGKQAALDDRIQEIARLTAEVAKLGAMIQNLPGEKARLEKAYQAISSVRADVLREAKSGNRFVSPKAIYLLIDSHLKRKEDAETDPQKKADFQVAHAVLTERTPPPGIPELDPDKHQGPREVMDRVIALLRYRHIKAVERFGKGSKEEEQATEAIESVYRHRAGMIYIRPSSVYLRTSFPSTSLQDDPNLAWDNMLLKQGLRNIPLSSELRDILNPAEKQDRSITSELDKQYWQNINRVRVSGAGFTNQALVKDDVGNWYVKQYSGDTERIWESAKNLALFSLSAKIPVDLAKQLQKSETPEQLAKHSKDQPTLQKLLDKHQGAYKSHTDEVQAKLEQLHTKAGTSELESRIIAAWNGNADIKETDFESELKTALKAQIQEWDKAASTLKDKKDQDPGQAIVKDVRALARLDKNLSAQITGMSLPDKLKDKPEVKTQAANGLHGIVKPLVFDLLEERKQALDRYEQAITFIGDAANPKEQDAKQSNGALKYEDVRK
ncbi:MAG: hypothetical protein IPP12_01770 [Nitrospira sp.]|nr:hypothetical protein [Nitrospira sp.]